MKFSIAERHNLIREEIDRNGFVKVSELAQKLGVTSPTIRKDLKILESQNILHRTHGSASVVKSPIVDESVKRKMSLNAHLKEGIAEAAQSLIEKDDAVIIAGGSTTTLFAGSIRPKGKLTVATPSIGIAVALNEIEDVKVLILGGILEKEPLSVRDRYSIEGLKYVNCSKLFMGCNGIDVVNGITCTSIEEAEFMEHVMNRIDKVVLLADSSKFSTRGHGRICGIDRIDVLVTDSGAPSHLLKVFEDAGTKVVIAGA